MALLAPISHGFLEDDDGSPGLYVTEAGVIVIRSVQGGPLVPVGGGGGSVTPPITLTGADPNTAALTIQDAVGQTVDSLAVLDETGAEFFGVLPAFGQVEIGDQSNVGPLVSLTAVGIRATENGGGTGVASLKSQPTQTQLQLETSTGQGVPIVIVSEPGQQFFRIDDDGSVHIKTGTTVQADL